MDGAAYILAINLVVGGVLASGFLLIAAYSRRYESARWIALAYFLGAAYFAFEFAVAALPRSQILATLTYATFLCALSSYAAGIARKYGEEPPWPILGAIVAGSVLLNIAVQELPRDWVIRQLLWQGPYAVLQIVAVTLLFRNPNRRPVDTLLGIVLIMSAAHFVLKPCIAQFAGGIGAQPGSYLHTTYALISQSTGTVFAIAVALLTLAVYVQSMLDDATIRSETDTLSGLLNRLGFEERADTMLRASERARVPLSLIICDIDRFKSVNDTFGHEAGDNVIKSFATILGESAGAGHAVGRIGGEEFAILMPGANLLTAKLVAEGARAAFAAAVIPGLPPHLRCTASFGVAQRQEAESYRELLRRADMALYEAKNAGRDRVRTSPSVSTLPSSEDRRAFRS